MKHLETSRRDSSPLHTRAVPPSASWLAAVRRRLQGFCPSRLRRAVAPRSAHPDRPLQPAADTHARLVALFTEASTLHDCALVETRVGEDALSYGDELKATQHFAYSRHYRLRAQETQATIDLEIARLRRERTDWQQLSSAALTRARERLYGSPELAGRPQFD